MAGWGDFDRGYPDKYLASQPWKLHFAGWETDTYRLQQNGWQLSAIQDPYYDSMQIAFQHPEYRIRGISARVSGYDARSQIYNSMNRMSGEFMPTIGAHLATDFVSHTATVAPFDKFRPIDAEPQLMDMRQMMSQNMVFAPNLARTQEIIVPEHSVDDLLNMMLEKQATNRAELIRRRVRQQGEYIDFQQRTNVHAQIVSIAA
ncbi:hypothetical protein UFOVP447_238 [uncultured Caudovirales phage]|uniref:Uncharacterized protein n=1 Tax=uncultured Caudovirales phage TaxID=2100421 RepID=A0A6J5MAQ4_9CAUD|nr:hypothetical protein UFOVP447_238 [uncultured Caudovirales phage]